MKKQPSRAGTCASCHMADAACFALMDRTVGVIECCGRCQHAGVLA